MGADAMGRAGTASAGAAIAAAIVGAGAVVAAIAAAVIGAVVVAAAAAVGGAGAIAGGAGLLREQRQREELVADVLRKLLAGRNLAESVRGHHQLHLGQNLQYNGHTNGNFKAAVTHVSSGHANRAHQAFQCKGNDGLIRNGQQHVLGHRYRGMAHPFLAAGVHEQHVDGDIHRTLDPGELRPVAEPVNAQVAHRSGGAAGSAGLKGPLTHGLGQRAIGVFGVFHRFIVGGGLAASALAVAAGQHRYDIGNGYANIIQLLLLHARVIDIRIMFRMQKERPIGTFFSSLPRY